MSRSDLATAAVDAVRAGGAFLAEEFRTGHVAGEYGVDDVKAEVDVAAERRVLAAIEEHFPDHATHGEESGRHGESDYVWVVDPLDGTNNFAADFPSFATAACCLSRDEPVVAAIYEPLPDTLYLAVDGAGAVETSAADAPAAAETLPDAGAEESPGRTLRADSETPLKHGTVSYVVGLPAVRDGDKTAAAERIPDALDPICKRVLETWSPCVDWGLLARGATEGVVCFHPDPYEQYPGTLLARESDAATREADGLFVAAGDEATCETLFDAAREVVDDA